MKMGIMGAHGTGKTTLAHEMAKNLEKTGIRTTVVSGAARACPWAINRDVTEGAQRWIYYKHMIMELEAMVSYEAVFCDRTSLDSMVYAFVAGFEDLVRDCCQGALEWLGSYDALFWARPREGWLKDDGTRNTDPAFQAEVDGVFDEWITKYEIPVTELGPDWE